MKRSTKFCTALMVLVMVFNLAITAYAAGSVTYDGDADRFIFTPGTEDSPSSLFENFQNVMPGDSPTEQILIKNDTPTVSRSRFICALWARRRTRMRSCPK